MDDNLIIMGINAPRQHQAIISKFVYGLTDYFQKKAPPISFTPER